MKIVLSNINPPNETHPFVSALVTFEDVLDDNPCSYLGSDIRVLVCIESRTDASLSEISASAIAHAKKILSAAVKRIGSE